MKHRVVTNGKTFKVQVRQWFGIAPLWVDFTFGVNEGGGSYTTESPTKEQALKKYFDNVKRTEWVEC